MNKNQKILDEVKKTISLLDNIHNIEPAPFLYTRVKAKLDSDKKITESSSNKFAFRVLQGFVFAILILFNIYSISRYLSNRSEDEQTRQTYLKNIMSEYSLNTENDYLIINESKE
jgi:hypothetical protein